MVGSRSGGSSEGQAGNGPKMSHLPSPPAAFISEYNVPRVPLYVCVRVRSVSVARTHLIVCRKRTLSLISSGILLRMCFRALAFSFRSWNSCSGRSIMNSAKQNTRALWRGATNSRWVIGRGAGPHARRACWSPGSMRLLKDQGPNQSPTFLSAVCLLIPITGGHAWITTEWTWEVNAAPSRTPAFQSAFAAIKSAFGRSCLVWKHVYCARTFKEAPLSVRDLSGETRGF